jgi:hypothetical protein
MGNCQGCLEKLDGEWSRDNDSSDESKSADLAVTDWRDGQLTLHQNDGSMDGIWVALVGQNGGKNWYIVVRGKDVTFTLSRTSSDKSQYRWTEFQMTADAAKTTFKANVDGQGGGKLAGSYTAKHPRHAQFQIKGARAGDYGAVMMKIMDSESFAAQQASTLDLGSEQKKGKGRMPKDPWMWGLSLEQLVHLRAYFQKLGVFSLNNFTREKRWQPPNMYIMNKDHFKPMTDGTDLSVAMLYNRGKPKRANVFISHAWGEVFLTFLATLQSGVVSGQRPLLPTDVAWICTLSINQNADISGELGASPEESPFAKVMKQADQVVVVFNDMTDLYRRVWCCFEMFLALDWKKDVRAIGAPWAWCTLCDNGDKMPTQQERHAAIVEGNAKHPVNVQEAEASVEQDKTDIMNSIHKWGDAMYDTINSTISKLRMQAWDDIITDGGVHIARKKFP